MGTQYTAGRGYVLLYPILKLQGEYIFNLQYLTAYTQPS